jgi:hypothetical protein
VLEAAFYVEVDIAASLVILLRVVGVLESCRLYASTAFV